jgi:hypothetical protein
VALRQRFVDVDQLHPGQPQPASLKAGDDLSDEPSLYRVGFDDD